ncbi:anti-sigma F factor antagonist [Dethiobacter alkaliphilus]|uniref:Anti-sigma F factor antagonist n=1 Tax=Dethiobacter alkaliphilus AHT 1 TaxID=555088 RepID=C0GDZ9_DETAL|nr:anti-sigma F factor antagonist [Dethiobacter alkaliphilus]EEG78293.1 anti-sigma-factor antagonist [Dethiobacter alkaliphilus AHT 1]MCW3491449.1 anti-sigma F factor antagonist [Dethiobacter alkaliphilus]
MDIKMKRAGNTLVVRMTGELDHHAVDGIRDRLDRKLAVEHIKNVVFNFSGVQFMDSSGLGMVLGRYKLISEKGGKVLACSLSPRVSRVFDLAGLQSRIPVFASEAEALKNV